MKPGIHFDISNEVYHSGPEVSNSGLALVAKAPALYRYATDNREQREPTEAQKIGTAVHTAMLEPDVFAKEYCRALRRQDAPDAIDDREVLAAMVTKLNDERIAAHPDAVRDTEQLQAMIAELNKDRQPKLSTGGSKAELVERIEAECYFPDLAELDPKPADMKVGELKAVIAAENERRPGLLSTSGTRQQLVDTLRSSGVEIELWSEVCAKHEAEHGTPYTFSTNASRHDMAAWLTANGHPVQLWSDVVAEWELNNGHRTVLSEDGWQQVMDMRDSLLAHPMASRMLKADGRAEVSVYWKDEETGVDCRVRPDFWAFSKRVVIDLKTTEDASREGFSRTVAKWGYHRQAAMYLHGCRQAIRQSGSDIPAPEAFAFIAIEKKPPYLVAVYVLQGESFGLGKAIFRRDLNHYARCLKDGAWPGYSDTIQELELPAWEFTQNQTDKD